MYGPRSKGHWTHIDVRDGGTAKLPLVIGRRFRVVQAFADYDGDEHPVGETWTFLGANANPYHDGMSWFVSPDDVSEWHIRMEWRDDTQGPVLENLELYLEPV